MRLPGLALPRFKKGTGRGRQAAATNILAGAICMATCLQMGPGVTGHGALWDRWQQRGTHLYQQLVLGVHADILEGGLMRRSILFWSKCT
jgi:hypothetical protein